MSLSRLIREAAKTGGVSVDYQRIVDRCGYVDYPSRTVVLNPDATEEEQDAELHDDLLKLIAASGRTLDLPAPRPIVQQHGLRLVE